MSDNLTQTRRKSFLFLATGVIIAGATAFSAWKVLHDYQRQLSEAKRPVGKIEVVVASRALLPGQVVEEADISLSQFSEAELPQAQVFSTREEVVGRVVEDRILPGEVVRKERFEGTDAVGQLETMVPEGARAVTVKVDREGGLGGMLKTGVYVDMIVTIRPDENNLGAAWVTETILQGVRVLGVGTTSQMETDENKTEKESKRLNPPRELYVTLEVEPDEAEIVAMASARGNIHLTLRSEGDLELLPQDKPLVTNAMVGLNPTPSPARVQRLAKRRAERQEVKPVETAPPPTTSAEVIQGSKVTQEHFDASGRKVEGGR